MRVCFLLDFGTRLLALDTGFTDMGGGGTAADDYHPASQPLSRHANNIIGIEMTKTLVPNVDASPGSQVISDQCCRELTTLWVARLDDGAELKVTDPKEQQRDVEEEEAEDEERWERVDC